MKIRISPPRHSSVLSALTAAVFAATASAASAQETPVPATPATDTASIPAVVSAPQSPVTVTVTGSTPAPPPEDPAVTEAKRELARLNMERERLAAENAIAKEKLTKELADRRAELERQTLKNDEDKAALAREMEEARIKADRETAALKLESERLALEALIAKNKTELRMSDLRLIEAEARAEITRLTSAMERRDKELSAAQYAERMPVYAENPLSEGTLTLSDRRIPLNGPIMARTADEVAERLDYFNNKNPKLPVFIVIDNSPGGSVMAGYKILKAMEGSEAPVYVVVKSFAASMAACITTLADKSFAYPNAVILHHQLSSMAFGNLTEQREDLREKEEWWQRLAGPIAKKMGITTEEFIKKMYARASTGDWTEFGDKAAELKWVDHIVHEIRETGQVKHPDLSPKPAPAAPLIIPLGGSGQVTAAPVMQECLDEKGRPFMLLPRPNPKDLYYLYNPDGYYRLR